MPVPVLFRRLLAVVLPTALLGVTLFFWKRRKKNVIEKSSEQPEVDYEVTQKTSEESITIADASIIDYKIATKVTEEEEPLPVFQTLFPNKSKTSKRTINEEVCYAVDVANDESSNFMYNNIEGHSDESDETDMVPDILSDSNQFDIRRKRYRNQNSCDGDSAIVEDYSSDRSFSETDSSTTKNTEDTLSILREAVENIEISEEEECHESNESGDEKPWCDYPLNDFDDYNESEESSTIQEDKISVTNKSNIKSNLSTSSYNKMSSSSSPRRKSKKKSQPRNKSPRKDITSPVKSSNNKSPKKKPNMPLKNKKNESSNQRQLDQPWRDAISTEPEDNSWVVLDYEFPDSKCGKLIGRSGKNVQEVKIKTGATICIEQEMFHGNRILSISGSKNQVRRAEKLLLEKFEDDMLKIREVTREIAATYMSKSQLDESCNVIVTAVENAGNFFIQMFKPEVDEALMQLQTDLDSVYAFPRQKYLFTEDDPPQVNDVCIGNIDNTWCRLKVKEVFQETYQAEVLFIDYGGSVVVPIQALLKIRSDFLDVPSLAIECYLAHITPLPGQDYFSADATSIFGQLIEGKVLQSTIASMDDKIPCLDLSYFDSSFQQLVSINKELANWGVANWK